MSNIGVGGGKPVQVFDTRFKFDMAPEVRNGIFGPSGFLQKCNQNTEFCDIVFVCGYRSFEVVHRVACPAELDARNTG